MSATLNQAKAKTLVNNDFTIQEFLYQSKNGHGSKMLWKVYEPSGQLRGAFHTIEAALHFTRPLNRPDWWV